MKGWVGVAVMIGWPWAASAAHGAADIDRALTELGREDATAVQAAVTALGATGDAKLLPLFEALREGSVYVWRRPGASPTAVIGGEKSTEGPEDTIELYAAYGREPLGRRVALSQLKEMPVDRTLRRLITPVIDRLAGQRQLGDPDPDVRRGDRNGDPGRPRDARHPSGGAGPRVGGLRARHD